MNSIGGTGGVMGQLCDTAKSVQALVPIDRWQSVSSFRVMMQKNTAINRHIAITWLKVWNSPFHRVDQLFFRIYPIVDLENYAQSYGPLKIVIWFYSKLSIWLIPFWYMPQNIFSREFAFNVIKQCLNQA